MGSDASPGADRADPAEPAARACAPSTTTIHMSTGRRWRRRSRSSRKLCGKHNWPIIDVTRRSIEETAAEVMALLADAPAAVVEAVNAMALWLAATSADARFEKRGRGARCWRRPAFRSRSSPPISTSARSRRAPALDDRARSPRRCWRGRRPKRWRRSIPAAWCSAPTRRWRSAAAFSKPSTSRRRRASSSRRCAANPYAAFGGGGVARDGAVLFEHVDAAHLTMRAFSDDFLDRYLDAVGRCGADQRRRLSARRHGHPSVRARRGRSFHRARPAAAAAAGLAAARRAIWRSRATHVHHRSHRLDRRWASPRRRGCSPRQGVPVHDADAAVHRLYERRGGRADRGGVSRHDHGRQGRSRGARPRRCSATPTALQRLEAIVHPLVREAETRFPEGGGSARRRGRGARHSAAVRDRRRQPGRRDRWWSRRRPRCSARVCWSAAA